MNALIRTGTRAGVWRLAAVALLPILVLGLLLTALWNPAERFDTVKAAIVNNDVPVTVDGQLVPLGRQLAAGLVSGAAPSTEQTVKAAPASDASYEWQLTNAAQARAGLADGTYAAVVTIPEDFSAAATSFGGDDPSKARQATIDVATPPGGRVADAVLARVVASTATSVLGSSLTQTFVDNVLVGFTTLSDQLGQAADGATQLQDGATSAADGATQLADGASQLAAGATSAASGAGDLADGAQQLATGARSASGGATALASGASQAASGAAQLAAGASTLADGAGGIATGAGQVSDGLGLATKGATDLADGAGDLKGQLTTAAAGASGAAQGLAGAATNIGGGVDALRTATTATNRALAEFLRLDGCDVAQPGPDCATHADLLTAMATIPVVLDGDGTTTPGLSGAVAGLKAAAGTPQDDPAQSTTLYALSNGLTAAADQGAGALQTGAQKLGTSLGQLQAGAAQVATGADGLQDGAQQFASKTTLLQGGVSQVAAGAGDLASGTRQLATGASGVASGADGLASGVGLLASGADGVTSGAQGLATGAGLLASGAGDLADGLGQAVDQVPSYSDGERATLASVVSDPVRAPGDDALDTGSTGPLFAVVALWLGALGLTTVVRPSRARALGATRGALRLAVSDLALPAAVAAVTGAVVGVVIAAVEHLSVGGWFGAIALGVLASVVFVTLHQGFSLLLGDLARGVSLLMAVLVIATGVVATVPGWLSSIADLLAIGDARQALVGLVVPAAGGVGAALVGLVVWGVAGLGLTVLATARARTVRVTRLLAAA
ncbi:hypothetical protein ET495_12105 [Xylanimonas allomyrinae]|uniref:YhgE/Pip domain-containing protein n=1 Tax=Xylanimonas allomyrinae TaxID=2509459 RepID=A0A4P6EMB7_9MICO|nr:hypothetical protein [Xylanimonas allomyrinae]QAY63854.1 hypothetical protein ET495_12105 [Xylanimonas allomyrinae]